MRAPDDPPRDGKRRALGLPSFSDKLLAEVIRMLLNAYYDVQFSDRSHGFRPGRGCHTALGEVVDVWNGTHWFIEGGIAQCFDSLDHQVMLKTMGEKILDNRFLRLIGGMLKAGYLEDWRWNATLSGVPQGGIASPIMSNIYRNTTGDGADGKTLTTNRCQGRSARRVNARTGKRRGHYAGNVAWCPARIFTIPDIEGCAIAGTPTVSSSASAARSPKRCKSSSSSGSSCKMSSN
jgi:retron-type reverse transcriptase